MIYKLNAKEKILEAILEEIRKESEKESECEITDEDLSRITGFSPKTIRKYVYVLSEQGYFDVYRGSGKKSCYRPGLRQEKI